MFDQSDSRTPFYDALSEDSPSSTSLWESRRQPS
jgi:hypothetical protein